MPTDAPLHGIRILEVSALGPAAITMPLIDLGAEVVKVEPPAGDYIREMTWPIVEGVSLMHLHSTGASARVVMDLRTEEDVATFKELAKICRRRRRGRTPRRTGPAGRGLRRPDRPQARHRVLHHLRLRHDRPLQGPARPRRGLRHLGRHRHPPGRRGRLLLPARARLDGHPRRAALRRAGHHGRRAAGQDHRRGLVPRDRPVRRRRRHGLVPERDVEGLRTPGIRGDRQQVGRLRAPRARARAA